MNFKDFVSGSWVEQYQYKSFSPTPVDHAWTWNDPQINTLLEEAMRALGELNAFSLIVPDVDLFIQMHVVKEASTSSRIEGTQTEIDEALRPRELVAPERRNDWQEVQNYIKAMNQGSMPYRHCRCQIGCSKIRTELFLRGCGELRNCRVDFVKVKTGSAAVGHPMPYSFHLITEK